MIVKSNHKNSSSSLVNSRNLFKLGTKSEPGGTLYCIIEPYKRVAA